MENFWKMEAIFSQNSPQNCNLDVFRGFQKKIRLSKPIASTLRVLPGIVSVDIQDVFVDTLDVAGVGIHLKQLCW